jgi:DNA-binding protein YbaB
MSEDISSMSSEELKDTISSALNDAKSNNSSSTQKASSMLSGSFLLNTYA